MLKDNMLRPVLPALDLARAKRFYEETLGLPIVLETPDGIVFAVGSTDGPSKTGWAPSSTFLVFPSPNPNRGGHTQMGFHVGDVDAEVADLKEKGIVFEEYDFPGAKTEDGIAVIAGGKGKAAWFKDPEGNLIGMVHLDF